MLVLTPRVPGGVDGPDEDAGAEGLRQQCLGGADGGGGEGDAEATLRAVAGRD